MMTLEGIFLGWRSMTQSPWRFQVEQSIQQMGQYDMGIIWYNLWIVRYTCPRDRQKLWGNKRPRRIFQPCFFGVWSWPLWVHVHEHGVINDTALVWHVRPIGPIFRQQPEDLLTWLGELVVTNKLHPIGTHPQFCLVIGYGISVCPYLVSCSVMFNDLKKLLVAEFLPVQVIMVNYPWLYPGFAWWTALQTALYPAARTSWIMVLDACHLWSWPGSNGSFKRGAMKYWIGWLVLKRDASDASRA